LRIGVRALLNGSHASSVGALAFPDGLRCASIGVLTFPDVRRCSSIGVLAFLGARRCSLRYAQGRHCGRGGTQRGGGRILRLSARMSNTYVLRVERGRLSGDRAEHCALPWTLVAVSPTRIAWSGRRSECRSRLIGRRWRREVSTRKRTAGIGNRISASRNPGTSRPTLEGRIPEPHYANQGTSSGTWSRTMRSWRGNPGIRQVFRRHAAPAAQSPVPV
jgi:hypothetical protein